MNRVTQLQRPINQNDSNLQTTGYVYSGDTPYDANGNVTSRQGNSISWSSYNYPTSINNTATAENVSFLYGPDRRAWFEQTISPGGMETAYHVGGLLDIVGTASVNDYRHYIYANGRPVAIDSRQSSGTNTVYYLLSDHEGSIAAITNSAGAVVVGENFTAYGNRRNPTIWSGAPSNSDLTTIAGITRQGYTFQDTLGQMGLNDMVGRVQDAVTGRFLSADPNIPDPTDPQSYNQYSYTRNNPLTYVDPSGFEDDAATCGDNPSCGGGGGGGGGGSLPDGVEPLNFTFDATMEDNSQQSDPSVQLPTAVVTASAISEGDYVAYTTWQNTHAWVPSPFGSGPGRQPASTPQQQSNQHFVQCPKPGFWSNVGHALTNFGSDVQQTGKESAQIGLVTGGTGIVTSAVGLPGEPLIFTGAVFLGAGALGEGVGIVLRLAGGGILAVEGNSQPLQSATVDMAQSHLNDQLGIPPGLPSPTQPVADALSGGNPCP